jgi:hypothetical protein
MMTKFDITVLRRFIVTSALAMTLFGALGCEETKVGTGSCVSHDECGEYQACDMDTGACICVDDRGCGDGEFCNAAARCQALSGCRTNSDCLVVEDDLCGSSFCDITSNRCIGYCECDPEEDEVCCSLDSQCAYNEICEDFSGKCRSGCRSDGDCMPGYGCTDIQAGGGVGVCTEGICTANNQCKYGELCNLETGECIFDSRGPYCESCTGGVASEDCGDPGNYCLLDTTDPTGQASFCGVNCAQGQACPNGYSCNEVIILPSSTPTCGVEICVITEGQPTGYCSQNTTINCSANADCPMGPPGGNCPRAVTGNCLIDQTQDCTEDIECCSDPTACPEGSCVKQRCRGGEGSAYGVCSCTRDLDCPRDECRGADLTDMDNPITGYCHLSGHPCYEDIDCDVIACIRGGCRIGANCTTGNDRSCRDILADD